jgi:hypothetical protein
MSPMNLSLLALIAPTLATSSAFFDRLGHLEQLVSAAATALSIPRRMAAGLLPATMLPDAFLENRAGQHGGGGGAVAGDVRGFRGHFVHELGAHVLEAVFQFDFLGDRDAVLGHGRAAKRLVDNDVAAGRAHGDRDRVGQFVRRPSIFDRA